MLELGELVDFDKLSQPPDPDTPAVTVMCRVEIDGVPYRFAVVVNAAPDAPDFAVISWAHAKTLRLVYDAVIDECESYRHVGGTVADRTE